MAVTQRWFRILTTAALGWWQGGRVTSGGESLIAPGSNVDRACCHALATLCQPAESVTADRLCHWRVDPEIIRHILAHTQEDTGDLSVAGTPAAVRCHDFPGVFWVAIPFTATDVTLALGVWATDKLQAVDGRIMSVNGAAMAFTTWPVHCRATGTTDAGLINFR